MKKIYKSLKVLSLGVAVLAFQFSNAQVYEVGVNDLFYPGGVSNNGVVSLSIGGTVMKWDQINGLMPIGSVSSGNGLSGMASISADGKKISASMDGPVSGAVEMAIYDVDTQVWTPLGGVTTTPMDGELSSGWAISADGKSVVGLGWVGGGNAHAIRWDEEGGLNDMGSIIQGRSSRANAISDDRTTVVGWQDEPDGYRAGAKWVNGVEEFIKDTDGNNVGEASAVSADGKVITGGNGLFPYVWSETSGYQEIVHPNSGPFFRGASTGISADGEKVIGYYRPWPGPPMMGEGFIWTEAGGLKNLNEYVASLGIDTKGIGFNLPLAISRDGKKIAGTGLKDNTTIVAFYIDLTTALATQEVQHAALAIVPNPAKDQFAIVGGKVESVEIYNIAGQKLSTPKLTDNKIDVSKLPAGLYIVQVTSGGKKQSLKLVKE